MSIPLNTSALNLTTVSPGISSTAFPDPDPVREDGGLILLVIACVCASLWQIYMTFYHSRLLGYIITRLITIKYLEDGQFFEIANLAPYLLALSFTSWIFPAPDIWSTFLKICAMPQSSFSLSILSGKIMFRDVKYITKDLSIRIVDGYAIFKYWLPYNPEDDYRKPYMPVSSENETGNEQKDQRLSIWINCFEYHVYNRSALYDRLQDLYKAERYGDAAKSTQNIHSILDTSKKESEKTPPSEQASSGLPHWLLELVPAIKFDISTGKVAFGSKLFETTLCFQFESAAGHYTTSQSHSSLDQFMHVIRCNGKNVRVMLCPSPGYTGTKNEPPRFMGNGFVVLQTAECRINYYQDEPGLVPEGNPSDTGADIPDSDPHWGVDVVFLKTTSMCYGPWVDRQRDALQRFFFPLDYQEMSVTKPLPASQTRIHTGLDVKFHFEADANLDILFSKQQETKAVHVCFGAGSHVGVYQPWTVNEYGYTTSVVTKLYQVEASTSMAYRRLVDADSLELAVHMSFPRVWNQTQHWSCDINVAKVTWWFIFAHKWFFQEMLEDWTASYRPDLLTFVPYEWSFNIILRDFEMVWAANEHNYLECSSNKQEIAELAFCGELFELTFVLQFLRFLPEVEEIKFFLQVEKVVARLCLPEHDTLRRSFLSLARMSTKQQTQPQVIRSRSSTNTALPEEGVESADETAGFHGTNSEMTSDIFRRHTAENIGWVDVMSVPILGLSIGYTYHPIIPNPKYNVPRDEPLKCHPSDLEPDVITLELEAGPAALRLFGSVLKILAAIKENYFGIDQVFQECASFSTSQTGFPEKEPTRDITSDTINLFALRPLETNVLISLYDFKAELTKHCGVNEPCSPLLLFERLTFEMHKTYAETRLQLHLTPMTVLVSDKYERGASGQHLSQGHLSLSGFQLRGHAMFSAKGLPPDSETLEYAWLTELQFGILSGKITLPQLQALLNWGQTFAFHVLNKENRLRPASPYKRCIHGHRQDRCLVFLNSAANCCVAHQQSPKLDSKTNKKSKATNSDDKTRKTSSLHPKLSLGGKGKGSTTPVAKEEDKEDAKTICLTEDNLKYRMTRISVEDINLFIVESGVACNVQVSPVRLAMCNLHSDNQTTGLSLFVQALKLRQFILAPKPIVDDPVLDDVHKRMSLCDDIIWMEAANLFLGPIISDVCLAEGRKEQLDQKSFLEEHDEKYQRIWFLWSSSEKHHLVKRPRSCGCVGGCNFFGRNTNGPRFFSSEKLDASANDTGITGFGSEGGFYDEWELNDEDETKPPFMYSHDALGSSYLDQSPVGSVEAFTRKRYHGSEASSSPKLRRPAYLRRAATRQEESNDQEHEGTCRLSWYSSLRRTSSSISAKATYMQMSSLQGSKPHIPPRTRPLHSCSSQLSHESEGSFYSCGSLLDDLDNVPPLHHGLSLETFESAVEDPDDLMKFGGSETHVSHFVVSCPQLVNRYSQQLSQLECLNWNVPAAIPSNKRMFSIVENLKETEPSDPLVIPGVPQFNYRNPPKFKQPLLVKKYQGPKRKEEQDEDADVSSSDSGSVFGGNAKLNLSQAENPSVQLDENFEQDSLRKARWKTAMNEGSLTSGDSSSEIQSSKKEQRPLQNLAIFRFNGDINVFLTPLCVDALQSYISSISRQDSILHPALVVDLVHDMCTSTAEGLYHKRLGHDLTSGLADTGAAKTNEVVALISTSNINLCFLQVAIPELKAEIRNDLELLEFPDESFKAKKPSISLLAGSLDGISAKVLSVQKAGVNHSQFSGSQNDIRQPDEQSALSSKPSDSHQMLTPKALHRNTSTVFNGKCNLVQLQLHELCNKEDFENSITTAITGKLSKSKFLVNADHLQSFADCSVAEDLRPGSYFSLLMLECGLEKISVQGGSECGNGCEILPKISQRPPSRHHTEKDKPTNSNGENSTVIHGYSNPIAEQETGSIRIDIKESEDENKSEKSGLSSLTSSLSFLTSSTGGSDSDIESEGDMDVYKPLLRPSKDQSVKKGDQKSGDKYSPKTNQHEVELARRIDADIGFSSIWLNIASPPSSRTLPENYHLYNSLVTTIVPLSVAWIPGILELNNLIKDVKANRNVRFTSVIACLMSQALPEHGKIPKKHGIHYLVTTLSKSLQEDHSSQLIYHLRRQLIGSRLNKVKTALLHTESIPESKKLVKGIFALARQWKCFLAGTEKGEILFYGTNSIKRHVVGRGVLTDRDRAILMKEESNAKEGAPPTQKLGTEITVGNVETEKAGVQAKDDEQQQVLDDSYSSPGNHSPKAQALLILPLRPDKTSPHPGSSSQHTPLLQASSGAPLNSDSDTDDSPSTTLRKGRQAKTLGENKAQKYGHRKQISLYSWLSNTPVTSPNASQQPDIVSHQPSHFTQVSPDKSEHDDKLFTEMISVPTSGKKIQDEKETFKTLLQAINLKPKVAESVDTANAISLKTSLKYIRLDLVDHEVNNMSKKRSQEEGKRQKSSSEKRAKEPVTDKDPIFLAKDFAFRLIFSNSPTWKDFPTDVPSLANTMVKRIKFNVCVGNITQKVNLPFVRLTIQLLDTVDLLAWFIKSKLQDGDNEDGPTPAFTTIFGAKEKPSASPSTVKCWKTMYQVLDLYSSLPREPKSKGHLNKATGSRPVRIDMPSPDQLKDVKIDIEDGPDLPPDKRRSVVSRSTWESKVQESNFVVVPTYVVMGVVTFPRARLLAAIGDLMLETEIRDVSMALTRKEEKDNNETDHCSGSVSGHVGSVNSVLLERVKRKTGMVVSCHLSRSTAIYTTASEFQREKNLALITIGVIDVEIPQHPVALHTMMTRSSRTISRHITDIQTQRSVIRSMGSHEMSPHRLSKRISGVPAEFVKHHLGSPTGLKMFSPIDSVDGSELAVTRVKFDVILKGFSLGASLLPSLRAGYKIGRISATAHTGPSIMFKASMPSHTLLFSSKAQTFDPNVPSSTTVDLPPVKVSGEFLTNRNRQPKYGMDGMPTQQRGKRGHLYVSTEIGSFQHSLTTDLLNHLVFVQKSFMKEVNDVVQRVSGESQPVPLWRTVSSESLDSSKHKEVSFLYSFGLTLKGIQVTATTPAATAVRLDTGEISLELSNAIPSPMEPGRLKRSGSFVKLFGKAQVDVNLSLGQFMKSRMIDNELDYLQMAYFKTTIGVRNSFQDVSSMHGTEDKETFLITLEQPKVFAQQIAFDKAVLVYLNYKNAYDHWNKQRMALNDEVHTATQALLEKLPARTHAAQLSGSLFLQLTVNRLGISVPLLTSNQPTTTTTTQGIHSKQSDHEQGSALVLSVEEMMLSCCSSTSFVSKGKFNKFCLWFADKFDKEASDWRPDLSSRLMNKCVVPHGTYELCSRTNRYPIVSAPEMVKTGKWMMSIRWQMCGVEILLDTNIGKRLSMLGSTLTAFGVETDIANMDSVADVTEKDVFKETSHVDEVDNKEVKSCKQSKRNIEREMWEQARKVNELRRRTDVSHLVLERETKILQDLENAVFNEFRKDVRKKLRRHSRGRQSSQRRAVSQGSPERHRKAKSERVKGSRSRTRVRRQIVQDFNDSDFDVSEMIDMSASVHHKTEKRDSDYLLNNTDIPVVLPFNLEDEEQFKIEQDLIELEHRSAQHSMSPFARTPDNKDATMGPGSPKVTFSTSTNDVQDENSVSQRADLLPQQNLDFELDVIVNIDSGKCVLHSVSESDSEDANDQRPLATRLFGADPPRTRSHFTPHPSSSGGTRRYKPSNQDGNSLPKDTVILLPGVDVRVNYSSNFESESRMSMSHTSDSSGLSAGSSLSTPRDQLFPSLPDARQSQTSTLSRKVSKKAGVYISVLFQSLPQEMVLKPSLIDFLEQALEPIIIPFENEDIDGVASVSDNSSDPDFETGGSIVSSSMSEASSFPVDVVLVFRVQPSDIRLSCQPVSKVECMLRLPALDVVFSSKSSPTKSSVLATPQQMLLGEQRKQETRESQAFDNGGVSFTFCLSSFSFCIFHPYGKEHTAVGRATSAPLEGEAETSEESRPRFRFTPPQPISGKKDSLSLDVEFVKFHLSRRRVGSSYVGDSRDGSNFPSSSSTVVKVSGVCDIGSAAFTYDMRRLNEILDFPKAWYKRKLVSRLFLGKEGSYAAKSVNVPTEVPYHQSQSVILDDIEDKRRSSPSVTETQRPRPQGRPMFSRSLSEDERRLSTPLKISPKQKSVTKKGASPSSGIFGFLPTSPILFRSMTMTGNKYGLLSSNSATPSPASHRRHASIDQKRRRKEEESPLLVAEQSSTDTDVDRPLSKSSSSSSGSKSKWETIIVVALNLSRLDVNTNMGSVMGQTMCSTSDLRAQSHLKLTSTGRRHFKAKLKVRQAVCGSRSGIVGGHVEINEFISKANVIEERGCKPQHLINFKVSHSEARIDYMGTCILMGNMSALKADLCDEWILQETNSASTDTLLASDKETPITSKIYVRADMSWTDFKLMISRSTTPDFIKMIAKIQEFFTQQHRNSLRALSTLRNPTPLATGTILSNLAMQQLLVPPSKEKDSECHGLKYQHWSKVLNALAGLKLCMLTNPIPERGVVLGGSLALHGKTVSLACFHGVNFRAQSWVLFNLKQFYTEFNSKVRSEEKSCQVRRVRAVQTLLIRLGHGDEETSSPGNLSPTAHIAIVRKVSRGRRNPPSMGSTVQEWLTYVCATGDDDIYPSDEEPTASKQRSDSFGSSSKKASQTSRNRTSGYRYEHDSEAIFALPKFDVELITEHDMPMGYMTSTWARKKHSTGSRVLPGPSSPHVVECSLVSSFKDSLCVTMDVGLLFFLHDVVQSYVKENETSSSASIPRSSPSPQAEQDIQASEKEDREKALKVDQQKRVRQFRSKTWKLEPRVRFMSWAGKNIDPVNMDWVLQKLGFTHARLTIPKWAQRGAMDPMDLVICMLIDKLMAAMREESKDE